MRNDVHYQGCDRRENGWVARFVWFIAQIFLLRPIERVLLYAIDLLDVDADQKVLAVVYKAYALLI